MLLLVPSRLELEKLVPEAAGAPQPWVWPGREDADGERVVVAACGIGLAWPGSNAAAMLVTGRLRSVLLAGLAGSYDAEAAPPGSLVTGSSVSLHGLGVGEGPAHRSLVEAGGVLSEEATDAERRRELVVPEGIEALRTPLLTVAASSADADEARDRSTRYPDCLVEDMESWPVARAAELCNASCSVLRGVSNLAGDRDHALWRVDEAAARLREAIDALTGAAA